MCCASREPAQNFQQYIDTAAGTGRYIPITLEQHWNGDHMRSVRRRMLAGETLPECEVCNNKLLNTDVYRDYFNHLFAHKWPEVQSSTDESGATTMQPVSWDYRFTNLCNFKCRMCGDMLSSAWESERKQHDLVDWTDNRNHWMRPEIKKQITAFQDSVIEQEFSDAVEQHRVEEVYWVGGEPLMYEQHWRYMQRIIELGDGPSVYARYNTNLSRINHLGVGLFKDILAKVRDWQICASLDGTGSVGEYIRYGLDYQTWLQNFKEGMSYAKHARQMRIDFTLTLPGLTEVLAIEQLAKELGCGLLAKTVFAFTPDNIWSPLILPRPALDAIVRPLLAQCQTTVMRDLLQQLLERPTFEETWPDVYPDAVQKGRQTVLQLEKIRKDKLIMADIVKQNPVLEAWWHDISS
jgi:hypothetical protein